MYPPFAVQSVRRLGGIGHKCGTGCGRWVPSDQRIVKQHRRLQVISVTAQVATMLRAQGCQLALRGRQEKRPSRRGSGCRKMDRGPEPHGFSAWSFFGRGWAVLQLNHSHLVVLTTAQLLLLFSSLPVYMLRDCKHAQVLSFEFESDPF